MISIFLWNINIFNDDKWKISTFKIAKPQKSLIKIDTKKISKDKYIGFKHQKNKLTQTTLWM